MQNAVARPSMQHAKDGELAGARLICAMLAILLGTFMSNLDVAIANIAIPAISLDLHSAADTAVWVVNAYQLAMGIFILPLAALGERWGYRRIHLGGVALFVIGSIACAVSPSIDMLITARTVQGIGGACLATVGPALLRIVVPHSMIGRALGWLALIVALSASTGPGLAAFILHASSWSWLFWVNVPVSVIVFVAAGFSLPSTRGAKRSFDASGAMMGGIALALSIIGIAGLNKAGSHAGLMIAAGVVLAALFVWHQRGLEHAILPNDLLAIPLFSVSLLTSICAYAAQAMALVSLPFLFEQTFGRSIRVSGMLMTPWPLVIVIVAPWAARLAERYRASVLCAIGLALLAGGLWASAALPADAGNLSIAWRLVICGIGFGLYQTPNNSMVMTSGPRNRSGAASAMMSLARLVGMTLGAAAATVMLGKGIDHATFTALVLAGGIAAAGSGISLLRLL
ncbi:MFS transporter [Paraburkholderia xenovorans]|uniref:MFS transporter n=1 Tax=Paraburkholderia xenovorans TaxID=36873 RepID=UPI001559BD5B|nr:MFS transporter [Paraburkholderia xenovorans]NPT36434.1 MFS transporter [Paraburkholderia xenovorans]